MNIFQFLNQREHACMKKSKSNTIRSTVLLSGAPLCNQKFCKYFAQTRSSRLSV